MNNKQPFSDLAIPPGEYLEEVLGELGMTKNELAVRMNRPASKLSAIFKGEKTITTETAMQLEKVVGVPANIWIGLESEYLLTLARNRESKEIQKLNEESHLVTKFCYSSLVKLGLVRKKTNDIEKAQELQRFFGVTSLENISNLKRYQVAFRQGTGSKQSPEAIAAWLRIGELRSQRTFHPPFSRSALEAALPEIRSLTHLPPEALNEKLQAALLKAGITLVICPHLPNTYLHGATFWLGEHKAVLMLTNRGVWADIFWFSLFHELGHILLHGKQRVFLEADAANMDRDKAEREADQFAANWLIPADEYKKFIEQRDFSPETIEKFAQRIHIDAGIVVGRLQHDGLIENSWHNSLRKRYKWS